MMNNLEIDAGGLIYREGDASDAVYFVTSGRVEVSRRSREEDIVLAVLGDGQIFGEMGVLQGKPRSTTTRALSDVVLVSMPVDVFMKAFGGPDSVPLTILRMLCERLRRVDGQLVDHYNREIATAVSVSRIAVLPGSPEMELQIGVEGIVLETLPFTVGRCNRTDVKPQVSPHALKVRPNEMFQIDIEHFVIEKHDGQIYVRDLASHLGTQVNGHRIAAFQYTSCAELGFGANEVIAGGIESPYRFRVVLDRTRSGSRPSDAI